MNLTTDQLAELLAGIARAQNALVDAVESANGGWRNAHLIPKLTVAANLRSGDPRLLDLPSRVLMRFQGRAAVDTALIKADLERLLSGGAAAPVAATAPVAPALAGGGLDFSKPA